MHKGWRLRLEERFWLRERRDAAARSGGTAIALPEERRRKSALSWASAATQLKRYRSKQRKLPRSDHRAQSRSPARSARAVGPRARNGQDDGIPQRTLSSAWLPPAPAPCGPASNVRARQPQRSSLDRAAQS
jgi:hypothetical protein